VCKWDYCYHSRLQILDCHLYKNISSSRRASATVSLPKGSLSSSVMHQKESCLLESSLEGFDVAQSSLLSTYPDRVSCPEWFSTLALPFLPRMPASSSPCAYFTSIHIAVPSRPPPSFSSVGGESNGLSIEINRSLPSASSSSLTTAFNPRYRHLNNTHVSSLQAKNTFSRRMHTVQKQDMYTQNTRPVNPAQIQKFKYVICSFVHRLSSKALSDA
jgi:hypothetical protein